MTPQEESFPTSNRLSRMSVQQKNPNEANLVKFTKAQRIFNREHMNRPLGEYQKNMIDGVLKKYGKYTVKRPIDKQTFRCLNSLVKRGLVINGVRLQLPV